MSEFTLTENTISPDKETVSGLRAVIDKMQLVETVRANDRALIDTLANGSRPYTVDECENFQIKINVNWGEMNRQIRDANRQVNSALIYKPVLFNLICRGGEVEKRDEYSIKATKNFNDCLTKKKTGKRFKFNLQSRNASFVLHGIGVLFWPNDYHSYPRFQPLENLLIPSDTSQDFSDLSYFDMKVDLTPYEFSKLTQGDKVMNGWDTEFARKILDSLQELKFQNPNNYNWWQHPEQMQELFKQNRTYLDSDAVAKVKLHFFFQRDDEDGKWYRKIFLRDESQYVSGIMGQVNKDEFVFDSDVPFADDIEQILHVQYGDNNIVPPKKFHSTRGLGQLLYSPAEVLNRYRSDILQSAFEANKTYFKIQSPADKSRQNVIDLMQYGVMEDGISFVPEAERHQVRTDLAEFVMSECRQSLSENSASFVQDIDTGTKKEMTLGEAQIRQQSVNLTVSSMLEMSYDQEVFLGVEMLRRFLFKNANTQESKWFVEQCVKDGIPKELLIDSMWDVKVEKVLGSGDASLANQEVATLMSWRPQFDPKSQRTILRMAATTVTKDPAKGMLLVPETEVQATDGRLEAENVFGTLMDGVPVTLREGIDQFGYIDGMMQMMGAIISRISQTDNVGTPQELIGLQTVSQDVAKHIELISADQQNAQKVKIYGDAIGKLDNLIKAFGQRQQQAAQKQQESVSPEAQAKAQAITTQSQLKIQTKEAEFEQKLQHREIQFQQKIEQQLKTSELNIKKMIAETMTQLMANKDIHQQQLAHDAATHSLNLTAQTEKEKIALEA